MPAKLALAGHKLYGLSNKYINGGMHEDTHT